MLKTTCLTVAMIGLLGGAAQSQTTSCGIACAVAPAPSAPSASSKKAAKQSDLDRIVCEKQDTTGTRLGEKKVCMTEAQRQEFENDMKDQTRRIQQTGLKTPE